VELKDATAGRLWAREDADRCFKWGQEGWERAQELYEALERPHHLVVSPGDMGREEIRDEGRRLIEEALNG
jgi:hypothetical protein